MDYVAHVTLINSNTIFFHTLSDFLAGHFEQFYLLIRRRIFHLDGLHATQFLKSEPREKIYFDWIERFRGTTENFVFALWFSFIFRFQSIYHCIFFRHPDLYHSTSFSYFSSPSLVLKIEKTSSFHFYLWSNRSRNKNCHGKISIHMKNGKQKNN